MDVEVRPATAEEMADQRAIVRYVFANPAVSDSEVGALLPEWSMCAFVDGRMATSAGAWPFRIRLNGRSVAAAGVTMVGTLPEYRRLGLLRQAMTRLLASARDQGQSLAILWASMGAIYQRYGYGLASSHVTYDIDPREIVFAGGEAATGRVRLVPRDEAMSTNQAIYREFNRDRNLLIQRALPLWEAHYQDRGEQKLQFGVYRNGAGEPRGFIAFRLGQDAGAEGRGQKLEIVDWAALDLDAHRGLWEFLAAHDIVGRVFWQSVPEDDPAPLWLAEPRRLNRKTGDAIWMRITDVEQALSQRRYGDADAVTIAVRDSLCPWNEGTFVLETTGDETRVERVDSPADLTMRVASLATLLAGFRSATHLARAGLLDAADDRVLGRADRLFATAYAPWCNDDF